MHAVTRPSRALEIDADPEPGDLIFNKQLYLGKIFAIPPEVELESARKLGSPGADADPESGDLIFDK